MKVQLTKKEAKTMLSLLMYVGGNYEAYSVLHKLEDKGVSMEGHYKIKVEDQGVDSPTITVSKKKVYYDA